MDPFTTGGEALLAAVPARVHRFAARIHELLQMRALLVHGSSSPVFPIVRVADGGAEADFNVFRHRERSWSYRHYATPSSPSLDAAQDASRGSHRRGTAS